MKVLKDGRDKKYYTMCSNCRSELEYTNEDIIGCFKTTIYVQFEGLLSK